MSGRAFEFLERMGDYFEEDENRTGDFNGTSDNTTMTGLTGLKPLSDAEVITVSIIGLLGFMGILMNTGVLAMVYNGLLLKRILMNTGVLAVVYKGRLVKSDYRMLYYIFMTCGDLMFALHTFINAFSLLFKDFYVFKIFYVCWNIQALLGVTSYQWSAICIILLIIDLTWSVKYPFSDNKKKKLFSKCSCIGTFFFAIALVIVPFLYWNDAPSELAFCSIGNVYGKHWDAYQQEAVSFLTVLLLCMLTACLNLLLEVYRKNSSDPAPKVKATYGIEANNGCHSPHPKVKDRIVTVSQGVPQLPLASTNGKRDDAGQTNAAFTMDDEHDIGTNAATGKLSQGHQATQAEEAMTQAQAHRKTFIRACRTVIFFVATYMGCCLPYYILLWMNIGCGTSCREDADTRRTRAIIASFLYLLPIIDPLLYIKRFQLFNRTIAKIWTSFKTTCTRG